MTCTPSFGHKVVASGWEVKTHNESHDERGRTRARDDARSRFPKPVVDGRRRVSCASEAFFAAAAASASGDRCQRRGGLVRVLSSPLSFRRARQDYCHAPPCGIRTRDVSIVSLGAPFSFCTRTRVCTLLPSGESH